uniref:Solute carrier family 15 member 2 n=1 Tax=Neogobius melanostomus TaxID=47308 RepID=A0A8C6WTN1_9GOBI
MPGTVCGTNYPLSICFIVVNEFCERFSYYGMKAVLTLYFVQYLHWDKDLSTAVYHAFSSLCYFTPIMGAIIADSWLGKFRTIIYLSIVYVIGHVVKSVGAIPTVGSSDMHIALSMIGLIMIAFGTGGIKPCVAAFGGDQFEEEHGKERQKFFSVFYMSINAGSLMSTIITPILRSDVQCFGGDCYALAFGVPAALMVVALVVFIGGSGMYKRNPPQGNVLLEVCKCIGYAISKRWKRSKHEEKKKHWLDWAEDKYSKRLIQEIKMVLRVLVLYIPLPMFWALFDQQASSAELDFDIGWNNTNLKCVQMFNETTANSLIVYSEGGWSAGGGDSIAVTKMEDVLANNIHVAWQLPQYVLMTAGEVMFSITGLEFSYSQSPANMKSVLQAGWLLTVAFGNIIVLIVAEGAGLEQWIEFLLFAGLLLAVFVIFSIMAHFYTYVNPEELDKVYLDDSKYAARDGKKRRPSDSLQMNKPDKSTKL